MKQLMGIAFFLVAIVFSGSVFAGFSSAWGNSGTTTSESESPSYRTCSESGGETEGGSGYTASWQNENGDTCPNEDSDGDTMINSWEDMFGLQWDGTGAEDDAYADADGDGATNLREYVQGTLADTSTGDPTGYTDTDGDGYLDGDDPTPTVADATDEGGKWSLDSTYTGGSTALDTEEQ